MASESGPYDKFWNITVFGQTSVFTGQRTWYLTTKGPVQPKLREDGCFVLESYPENADFEETVALFLPGQAVGFIQEVADDDSEPELVEEPEFASDGNLGELNDEQEVDTEA